MKRKIREFIDRSIKNLNLQIVSLTQLNQGWFLELRTDENIIARVKMMLTTWQNTLANIQVADLPSINVVIQGNGEYPDRLVHLQDNKLYYAGDEHQLVPQFCDFNEWFKGIFKFNFPEILTSSGELKRASEELRWLTPGANSWFPNQVDIFKAEKGKEKILDGLAVGHWGNGINSYAFYFISQFKNRFRGLRMGYGGVYSNHERDLRDITEIIQFIAIIDTATRERIISENFRINLGEVYWKITFENNRTFQYSKFSKPQLIVRDKGRCVKSWEVDSDDALNLSPLGAPFGRIAAAIYFAMNSEFEPLTRTIERENNDRI